MSGNQKRFLWTYRREYPPEKLVAIQGFGYKYVDVQLISRVSGACCFTPPAKTACPGQIKPLHFHHGGATVEGPRSKSLVVSHQPVALFLPGRKGAGIMAYVDASESPMRFW